MEFLKLFFAEFLLGYILQSFTFVLALYAFTKTKFILNQYILTSLIFTVSTYFVRLLPISLGIHTLLNLLVLMALGILYLKIPVFSTMFATMSSIIIVCIYESIGLLIIESIVGQEQFLPFMSVRLNKAMVGVPINLMVTVTICACFFIIKRTRSRGKHSHGEVSK